MSTKIYDAYKLKLKDASASELNRVLNELRPRMRKLADKLMRKTYSRDVVSLVDRVAIAREWPVHESVVDDCKFNSLVDACYDTYAERLKKIKQDGTRDPEIDMFFEVAVYPEYNLAKIYTEQDELRDLWETQSFVEGCYSYWNNCDKPDEVSDEEWQERSNVWEQVFPGHSTPSETCLTKTLVPQGFFGTYEVADVLETQPGVQDRAAWQATNILGFRYEEAGHKFDHDRYWEMLGWAISEEGQASKARFTIKILGLLPTVTEDMLLGKLPKLMESMGAKTYNDKKTTSTG